MNQNQNEVQCAALCCSHWCTVAAQCHFLLKKFKRSPPVKQVSCYVKTACLNWWPSPFCLSNGVMQTCVTLSLWSGSHHGPFFFFFTRPRSSMPLRRERSGVFHFWWCWAIRTYQLHKIETVKKKGKKRSWEHVPLMCFSDGFLHVQST